MRGWGVKGESVHALIQCWERRKHNSCLSDVMIKVSPKVRIGSKATHLSEVNLNMLAIAVKDVRIQNQVLCHQFKARLSS